MALLSKDSVSGRFIEGRDLREDPEVASATFPKILLIGGCGYVGSYIFQRLVCDGFTVAVVDQLKRGNPLGLTVIKE